MLVRNTVVVILWIMLGGVSVNFHTFKLRLRIQEQLSFLIRILMELFSAIG